ncbi:MAG: asparagine synthase-related protein, partial [Allosphingosinicella sp.]
FMLHAPDFLGYPDAVAMAKDHRAWVARGLGIKKAGNAIVTALGGIFSFSARPDLREACGTMLRAQRLYGAGRPVLWSGERIVLGRDLFRTLPEDSFDHGPVVAREGRFALAADVRLDNREALWRELGFDRAELPRQPDAFILMEALIRWGAAAVDRLRGDFAFAFWSGQAQSLLLARDFLGQRPLHFHRNADLLAFASMPKGLHALPEVPRRPDAGKVAEFLALLPENEPASFFEGVERVLPGHICTVTAGGIASDRYWTPSPRPLRLSSAADYAEAVREQVDRAVASRLRRAGGGVGAHLSGGLDSSTVAATAARLLAPADRVTAYTAVPREGYAEPVPRGRFADEGINAARVAAAHPNIEHVLIRSGGTSPLASLDRSFFLFERPVLNLCNGVWLEAIMDAAKRSGLSVMLTGQMGNLSFSYAGLETLPALLARGRWIRLARLAMQLRRHGTTLESVAARTFGPYLPRWLWRAANRRRGRDYRVGAYSALKPECAADLSARASLSGLDFSYRPRRDPIEMRLWALRRIDLGNYNKGYLGGWGIDVRDPTADRDLVELCLSIPSAEFVRDGRSRALARAAFADRLPQPVIEETRKGLQGADWHEGLAAAREEVADELERTAASLPADGPLDVNRLRALVADWPEGEWNSPAVQWKYRLALLRGVSAGNFLRKATGSNL